MWASTPSSIYFKEYESCQFCNLFSSVTIFPFFPFLVCSEIKKFTIPVCFYSLLFIVQILKLWGSPKTYFDYNNPWYNGSNHKDKKNIKNEIKKSISTGKLDIWSLFFSTCTVLKFYLPSSSTIPVFNHTSMVITCVCQFAISGTKWLTWCWSF